MPGALAQALVTEGHADPEAAAGAVADALASGPFSVARKGYMAVASRLGLAPRVFVSATAHYSLTKACNVLGYGEDAMRLVPVTDRFRLDIDALEEMLGELSDQEYVAAVVGVLGTTEEGAVDPLHAVQALRERLAAEANMAFWLHTDAAYGGYVASVFRGHKVDSDDPARILYEYATAIDASEPVHNIAGQATEILEEDVRWDDPDVYSACLAVGGSDSVTVDPHKLGYVPYPAGLVAFKDARVTDLLAQRAPYLSEFASTGGRGSEDPVDAVGPYILEGSKPGAAAVACWLAHTAIPLDASGHGQIVRSTLLSAAKLARYLEEHRHLYGQLERELNDDEAGAEPFCFRPILKPDLNIVCFVAVPMAFEGERLVPTAVDLARINALTREIHGLMCGPMKGGMPYRHPFYVSRTEFGVNQYSPESMGPLLDRLRASEDDYRRNGLFVLRSVVMNPLYRLAETESGKDYLLDFVRDLHSAARRSLTKLAPDG
jgi:tyrosine decarboxylase